MAVMVFCARFPISITGSWASARLHQRSSPRSRLRLRCLRIRLSCLDRHTPAIHELLFATINAVKGASLPLSDIHTSTQAQTGEEHEDAQHVLHGLFSFLYCHIAGRCKGCVSRTLHICPASTSIVGRVSRARPSRGLRA